jgi:hypothetical protein
MLFDKWVFSDGRMGRPMVPPLHPTEIPDTKAVAEAEEQVRVQAEAVRRLKVQQQLSNQVEGL